MLNQLKLGQTFQFGWLLTNVLGEAVDADALPTVATIFKNKVATVETATVTDQTGDEVGSYALSFTPASPAVDALYELVVESVLDGSTKSMKVQFVVTAVPFDAASDEVDLGKILGTALTEQSAGNIANNQSVFWDNDDTTDGFPFLGRIEDCYTQIIDRPTNAEFEARTLPAATYALVGEQEAAFELLETIESEVGQIKSRRPNYSAYENAIYVKASGNDSLGGTEDQPYATLTKAKTEASAGDIIVVGPGTYDEDDLAKNGVDWYFERGAKVVKTTTGSTPYLFDDGGVAMIYNVLGKGHFEHVTKSYARSNHVNSRTYHESSYIKVDGRVFLNGNGYMKGKGEYFECTDAIIDTVSADATCVLNADELVVSGSGWAVENDKGLSIVKARRITAGSSCVEMASAGGFVIIDAEEMTSGNDGTINAGVDCTVIIKNAAIKDLNDDGSVYLDGVANVTLINCVRGTVTEGGGFTGTFRETNDTMSANVDSILEDTAELQSNQGDWTTATTVAVDSMSQAALAQFVTDDTGETAETVSGTSVTGLGQADSGEGVSVVLGALGHIPERVNGYELNVFNEEQITLVVPMYAPDTTPIDLTGQSLWFGIEGRTKEVLYTGVATGTETGFSVALAKISKVQSGLTWALRRTTTGVLLGHGPFKITRRPYDAPVP